MHLLAHASRSLLVILSLLVICSEGDSVTLPTTVTSGSAHVLFITNKRPHGRPSAVKHLQGQPYGPMATQSLLPQRKYGSVDESNKTHVFPVSDPRSDTSSSQSGDPLRVWEPVGGGGAARRKRWFTIALVGGIAVGVIMAAMHAEYRVQKLTRASNAGFVEVDRVPALAEAPPGGEPAQPVVDGSSPSLALLSPLLDHQLSFTALNFYHVRDGKPAQDYPWLQDVKLVEPHRETTLAVVSAREGFEYRWEVRGSREPARVLVAGYGAEWVAVFSELDENLITLEEVAADGEVTRRLHEEVMVKYVRREIRTLTDEEREELFDAMYQLWAVKVDGGEGAETYGDDYADIWAINRLHFKAASPLECDHFHDGLGFLTNHAMISNTFEYSLQVVNPKLTLPYWDFTIESSSAGAVNGDSVDQSQTKSPIFDETWFGTFDSMDNQVKDGRWAYTEIPKMLTNDPGAIEPDVYSKLRAPWNVNDRAYLTRGMGKMCGVNMDEDYPWPTCDTHYQLATSFSDFYSWVWYSLYDPHGPVHVWIGGVLDCEKTYHEIGKLVGEEAAKDLALFAFVHRKNLFRNKMFKCDGHVGIDQSPTEVLSSGVCGCLDYDLTQGDDYETIYNSMVMIGDILGDANADTKRQVVAALCTTPMNDGDHLQASSSLDPSFWATHPTMERLWMFSVLTGQITDYTWPDTDTTYTDSDGTVVSESLSLYDESCEGHRGSDVFPFGLLDSDTDGFEVKTGISGASVTGNTLTNREALRAFDPRANVLSYVYDTFKWEHCGVDGFDFDEAWTQSTTKTSSVPRPTFEKGVPRAPRYKSMLKLMAEYKAKGTSHD